MHPADQQAPSIHWTPIELWIIIQTVVEQAAAEAQAAQRRFVAAQMAAELAAIEKAMHENSFLRFHRALPTPNANFF